MNTSTKSLIITLAGYIITSLFAFFVIYPLFGITLAFVDTLAVGLIFTALAYVVNYSCLSIFNLIEKKENYID